MSWYKYWYYTIFFIYDSIFKNTESNKTFAVGLFSVTVYMMIAMINGVLYVTSGIAMMKYLCHIYSHVLLALIIYCLNGFLFWPDRRARKERGIYREISRPRKNLLFVVLTILVFAAYFYVLFNYKEYFLLIY